MLTFYDQLHDHQPQNSTYYDHANCFTVKPNSVLGSCFFFFFFFCQIQAHLLYLSKENVSSFKVEWVLSFVNIPLFTFITPSELLTSSSSSMRDLTHFHSYLSYCLNHCWILLTTIIWDVLSQLLTMASAKRGFFFFTSSKPGSLFASKHLLRSSDTSDIKMK